MSASSNYDDDVLEDGGEDGLRLLYNSLNKKLIQLSEAIDLSSINIDDPTDKTFDRLMKAMVESKDIAQNLIWLKTQLNLLTNKDEPTEPAKAKRNPVESRAK